MAAAPAWVPVFVEEVPEEIPRRLPRLAAKEYIRAAVIDEEGEVEGFDDEAEEEDIIRLLESTTKAEKHFLVSLMSFLILLSVLPS